MRTVRKGDALYMGVDIGGTKIQASLVTQSGVVLTRTKKRTPRQTGSDGVLAAIEEAIRGTLELDKQPIPAERLSGIGVAVPGVVDPDSGLVVVAPNMQFDRVELGPRLERAFKIPVSIGNDCNLGTLGEKWLGSARHAQSVVGILVGTGIGAGIVQGSHLWRGARESAAEIGHIVMQIGGPVCGCGNRGCFEALASRSAIERDIREAIAAGRTSILSELLEGDLSVIRSGMLHQALADDDEVVSEVMQHASEVLGHACVTVRHLLDPEVIVLGGGVLEACSDFVMPIVQRVVAADRLPGVDREGLFTSRPILLSSLGDDAVVLGAVALAQIDLDRSPLRKRAETRLAYPTVGKVRPGKIVVDRTSYSRDIAIRVDGRVRKWKNTFDELPEDAPREIGRKELSKACKGGPEVLFVGTGSTRKIRLDEKAEQFLHWRSIEYHILPTEEAAAAYNKSRQRKVALFRVPE